MTRSYIKHPEIKAGDKFYYLEVISPPFYETYPNGRKRRKLLCKCICGKEKVFMYDSFICKNELDRAKSCGCKHIYRNNLNAQKEDPQKVFIDTYMNNINLVQNLETLSLNYQKKITLK